MASLTLVVPASSSPSSLISPRVVTANRNCRPRRAPRWLPRRRRKRPALFFLAGENAGGGRREGVRARPCAHSCYGSSRCLGTAATNTTSQVRLLRASPLVAPAAPSRQGTQSTSQPQSDGPRFLCCNARANLFRFLVPEAFSSS